VQPPGRPVPFSHPLGLLKSPGGGQVVSDGAMKSSIRNGLFVKWLSNGVAVVVSLHVGLSGGVARFASFCNRQVKGVPAWLTWVVCAGSARRRPLTPSQPP
jgi:hypothetical protein